MTNEQLSAELERQARSFIEKDGGEVIPYAAQAKPDKRPWRKTARLLDDAFQAEIRKIESPHYVDA